MFLIYLNTPLSTFEYVRLPINIIPEIMIMQYNLLSLVVDGSIYIEIQKGMYALPQTRKLAYDRLKHHIDQYGYILASFTPGL